MSATWNTLIAFFIYVIVVTLITKSAFESKKAEKDVVSDKSREGSLSVISTRIIRPIIFLLISSLLLLRSNYLLELFEITHYDWYIPLIIAVGFGLIYAFFPVTSSKSLAFFLILVHMRFIYLIIVAVLITILVSINVFLSAVIILIPSSIFAGVGYFLVRYSYRTYEFTGASIATIIFITIILFTARRAYELTKSALNSSVKPIWKFGYHGIINAWKQFCISLHNFFRNHAIYLGTKMGGDIMLFSEKKAQSSID